MSPSLPGVHLFYHSRRQDTRILDGLYWGLGEQGIPCRSIYYDEHDCVLILGKPAAKSPVLRVGLGPDAMGDIALTHAQLPGNRALIRGHIRAGIAQIRMPGVNAGQLVKILPFGEIK